ncbi:hypothetical protein OIU79_030657 [Salix purpurea]|uniref:Uncharacterized protein n=1 Tax=Salix purpurea TaxID=77065 RepID=A0A9Q0ZRP5_SALPP|nr:hypothetical protein OIU79_030657 [Salix purpurea]
MLPLKFKNKNKFQEVNESMFLKDMSRMIMIFYPFSQSLKEQLNQSNTVLEYALYTKLKKNSSQS